MPTRKKRRKADSGMVGKALEYFATQQDFFAERRNSGAIKIGARLIKLGAPGTLDISGYFTPPRGFAIYFEIEAKSSTGEPRKSQLKRMADLTKARVPFCVARTLDDVRNFVVELRLRVAALGGGK